MTDDQRRTNVTEGQMPSTSPKILAASATAPVVPSTLPADAAAARTGRRRSGSPAPGAAGPKYEASIYPGAGHPLPEPFCQAVVELGHSLGKQMWMLVQGVDGHDYDELNDTVAQAFIDAEHELPPGKEVALLLHSYGGFADSAYAIARVLRNACGAFTVVVPRHAKSAATLIALGARNRLMGRHAELGPLDVQIMDPEREDVTSALNEVQSLERLNAFAMQAVDEWMFLMKPRTRKRTETLLPMVMQFVGVMMQPLFDKIDTVHYTQNSRLLRVAEEYAVRLLQPDLSPQRARAIASHLIEKYPEHGFAIYAEEVRSLGLSVDDPTEEQDRLLARIAQHVPRTVAIGRLREIKP